MPHASDARFWDQIADSYARKPFPNPEATARKLAVTRALLRPTDRLLDLGCGTGTIALELAPGVTEAQGIDVSGEMIRIARSKAVGRANVSFHVMPAGTLEDIPDASWDCVCLFNLLHLVPDAPALLRGVRRVLRPGGRVVSSTACLGDAWVPYRPILAVMRWLGKAPRVTLLTRRGLEQAMRDAGLVDLEAPDVGEDTTTAFLVARVPG